MPLCVHGRPGASGSRVYNVQYIYQVAPGLKHGGLGGAIQHLGFRRGRGTSGGAPPADIFGAQERIMPGHQLRVAGMSCTGGPGFSLKRRLFFFACVGVYRCCCSLQFATGSPFSEGENV